MVVLGCIDLIRPSKTPSLFFKTQQIYQEVSFSIHEETDLKKHKVPTYTSRA